jgi:hypothetical protein
MTPSNQPSISDLTNELKQLTQSLESGGGGKDFQMSEAAHQKYMTHIKDYREKLTALRHQAAGLTSYGPVGSFLSAVDTKSQLAGDVTPSAVASLDLYTSYLEQFENAVNAAFNRMQAEDEAR